MGDKMVRITKASAPRAQMPPAALELQQRAAASMFLALLSLIAMLINGHVQRAPYVFGVALAVALAGLGLAISCFLSAKRAGSRRPRGSVAGLVFSSICVLFSAFALSGYLLFWSQFTQLSNCLNAAGSSTAAQNACQAQFYKDAMNSVTNSGGS